MSLNFSILLYSKYSSNCKKLFDILKNNETNLSLSAVCIDNNKIRKRILNDKIFMVKEVPTIINIYENGAAEKYEGTKSFDLIYSLVKPVESNYVNEETKKVVAKKEINEEINEEIDEIKIPTTMKKITSIENIHMDDTDRNINRKQPKRIRQDQNNYIEDDELFQGEIIEHVKEPSNTVKTTSQKNTQDPFGTLAKAKEMAQMREITENDINNPSQRPMDARRP
jgi:hypothetical protein